MKLRDIRGLITVHDIQAVIAGEETIAVDNAAWYPPNTFMVTPHFGDGTPTCG